MEVVSIVGQVIFGLFFIFNGVNHFIKTKDMAAYAKSKKVPLPVLAVVVAGLLLFFGGLSILTGLHLQYGLWLLVVFFVTVTLWMHNFWAIEDAQTKMTDSIHFMKNMAILGAILLMMSYVDSWPWVFNIG